MKNQEPIILKTWKGNGNGSILLTIPNTITKEYDLEDPTYIILEKKSNGIFLKKFRG